MTTNNELVQASRKEIVYTPEGSTQELRLTSSIVLETLVKPTKNGKVPQKPDLTAFMMTCKHMRLNPYLGEIFMVGFDNSQTGEGEFSIILGHPAFLKRAEAHAAFEGMESGLILEDLEEVEGDFVPPGKKAIGAWARVHRSDRKIQVYRRLNIEKYNQNRNLWKKNPEMMAVKCAEADALRSAFPSDLGGMYMAEEVHVKQAPQPATILENEIVSDDDGEFAPTPKQIEQPKPKTKPASRKRATKPKPEPAPAPQPEQEAAPTTQAELEPSPQAIGPQVATLKGRLETDGILIGAENYMPTMGLLDEGQSIDAMREGTAASILKNYDNFKSTIEQSIQS